jgi:hypothetical protein
VHILILNRSFILYMAFLYFLIRQAYRIHTGIISHGRRSKYSKRQSTTVTRRRHVNDLHFRPTYFKTRALISTRPVQHIRYNARLHAVWSATAKIEVCPVTGTAEIPRERGRCSRYYRDERNDLYGNPVRTVTIIN